ncbi:type I-B CRISPR-associated protein Cas5b [Clostridium sp. BJN0001]|uniref:type I-B CRISPR-associated protein Cas5b n=1 Tax=Clostridium sp. BJN0001 TaxID=2930219 RepID=UPI001FD593DA|nr:type I-B CRISPR-associated protein Cas5b [Clostridium sp. BJN0001]
MNTLIFIASGDYARFRCPYSTTSALTYTIMHPIAIKGLVGAIMGIDYKDLYEYTKNMKIAVQLLKPVKKDIQSFNYIAQTKNNDAANFQTRIEFLRDVSYRIFISDDDDKLSKIKDTLLNRNFIFTPYLGASEHIAKIDYEAYSEVNDINNDKDILVDSAVLKENLSLENKTSLYIDRIPIQNNETREYILYQNVAFSYNKKLKVNSNMIKSAGGYNVYFF